jgi:hypothetical protein
MFWLTSRAPLRNRVWHTACPSDNPKEQGIRVIVMKISMFAALVLLGTELMARASVHGVEQAIVSTVIEWTVNQMKAARNFLR